MVYLRSSILIINCYNFNSRVFVWLLLNTVIIPFIQVLKALDQLHDVDTAHKTERYILAYLEQDKRKEKAIKPPVSYIQYNRCNKKGINCLLSHVAVLY